MRHALFEELDRPPRPLVESNAGVAVALHPALEADDALTLAYCDHTIIDGAGAVDQAAADANTRHWKRDLLARGVVRPLLPHLKTIPAAMAALFRKSAVDWSDFPPEVGTHYDYWLAYLASDIVYNGKEHDGVQKKYRPRSYDGGPKQE